MKDILFVLGNGPSLGNIMNNDTYLKYLRNQDTFCLNNFYKMMEKYNFTPTYYGCFDYVVNENKEKDYSNLVLQENGIKEFYFIGSNSRKQSLYTKDVINNNRFVNFNFHDKGVNAFNQISKNFDNFINAGASGPNALQVGIMKGYKKIILLGCDCNYVEKIDGVVSISGKLVVNDDIKKNPNYWFPGYHSKGDIYNFPETRKFHIGGWKNIFEHCPKDVTILNCSEISKIPFFEKVTFDKICNSD
jgi:hypothetical protein